MTIRERIENYFRGQGMVSMNPEHAREKIYKRSEEAFRSIHTNPLGYDGAFRYFSVLADHYDLCMAPYMDSFVEHLEFLYRAVRGKDLTIEAGCATGHDLCFLAQERKNQKFMGYDFVPRMVEISRERAERMGLDNVEFCLADHSGAPGKIEKRANLVVASGSCFETTEEGMEEFSHSMWNLLVPRGRYMNIAFSKAGLWDMMKNAAEDIGFDIESEERVSTHEKATVFRRS